MTCWFVGAPKFARQRGFQAGTIRSEDSQIVAAYGKMSIGNVLRPFRAERGIGFNFCNTGKGSFWGGLRRISAD
jgi:hypothetical protein